MLASMRASMNISLPEPLKEWVDSQVAAGGYGTASEYVRHLLREEQQRRLREQIDRSLVESLDSGPSTPMTAADWDHIRREGKRRIAARKRKRA
jgi:antitoxin ParD1/3/4